MPYVSLSTVQLIQARCGPQRAAVADHRHVCLARQPLMAVDALTQAGRQHSSSSTRKLQAVRQWRMAAAEATAPASDSSSSLAPDRQGYRAFKMESCEFLVAELPDGRLDLRDVYVVTEQEVKAEAVDQDWVDGEVGEMPGEDEELAERLAGRQRAAPEVVTSTERASTSGELPPGPMHFHELPWFAEYQGDIFKNKEPKRWVLKLFLIALESVEPRRLSMEELWVLDNKGRSLSRVEVQRLAPPGTPLQDLRLRITRDGTVTIDTLQSQPSWEQVVRAALAGHRATSALEREAAARSGDSESSSSSGEEEEGLYAPATASVMEPEELYGDEYDEDNLRDFVEEWSDEREEMEEYDADLGS